MTLLLVKLLQRTTIWPNLHTNAVALMSRCASRARPSLCKEPHLRLVARNQHDSLFADQEGRNESGHLTQKKYRTID